MLLVSCGTDVKLHDCLSYDLVHVYHPNSAGLIRNVCWCKDGSWLAMVPQCGYAEVIHIQDDIRQTILGVAQPTTAACQRTTVQNVAMGTATGSVFVYDIKVKGIIKQFVNSDSTVNMLDWSNNDTHLASGNNSGQVTIYSNKTNQKISVFTLPDSKSVSVVRFHPTQTAILGTASEDGAVVVWDVNNRTYDMCLKHKSVTDLAFSTLNPKLMISVGLDHSFNCYDIKTGTLVLPVTTEQPLSAVDLALDGSTLALASTLGTIYIYDLRKLDLPIKTLESHSGEITKIYFQPISNDDESLSSVDSFSKNDSFLNALEEEKPKLSNLRLRENVAKWLDSKKSFENKSSTSGISSGSDVEPTQPKNSVQSNRISVEELTQTINTTVKQVVSEQMSDVTDMLSNCFLNLQLSISKQFVGYETQMERLFGYNCGVSENSTLMAQIQQLEQENEFLRSHINELMHRNT